MSSRPGRPRHSGGAGPLAPREEILGAAAHLFVDQGFARTSTREIADLVGIRQASLYYHFAGKDGILAELLQQSVRPSLDKVEQIEAECPAKVPEAALYLLALIDVHTLARAPQNIGKLYRMPDVMKLEIYKQFRASLKALTEAYGRLGARIASEPVAATTSTNQLGGILIQLTETVIKSRADNHKIRPTETHALATSCLRACGVPQDRIELAAASATDLMPVFNEEQHAQ